MHQKNIYDAIEVLEWQKEQLLFQIKQMEKVIAMLKKDVTAGIDKNKESTHDDCEECKNGGHKLI